ncbi:DUF859 family phage minor structural protein [Dorea sp. D27]|uniref:DUF859 family phage minor structural protein n=1 Tax=Dorea sp. D27 TaxID=658665 RepID=UPI0006737E21|nr:DUF859 family phage minor structural protein [Dorea sp. D27]
MIFSINIIQGKLMASGSWNFNTSNQYITGRVRWSSQSNGSNANSSNVTAYLDYMKSSSSTAATYGTFNGSISINGSAGGVSQYITLYANNSWVNVGSRTITVGHNNDGSKSTSIAASGGISGTSFGSSSTSNNVTLDKIPRYANITIWKNTSVAQTSATFQWGTDAACSAVHYMIGNGPWIGTSGTTFTVPGLAPNTSYSVKIKVKRTDSGLETISNAITVKTQPIASISNANLEFDIGKNLTLTLMDYNLNASSLLFDVECDDNTWTSGLLSIASGINVQNVTLPLSNIADTLYSCCKARNEMRFKISCGTTIDKVYYENIFYGTAHIIDSNPVFSNYTYSNTDAATSSVLQNSSYIIENYGNMQAQISPSNQAHPKNQASIIGYITTVTNEKDETKKQVKTDFSANNTLINLGTLSEAGDYKINIYAIDSRGNKSATISKAFYVLPYSRPAARIALSRINEFEKEITIDFSTVYSRLKLGNANKNSPLTLKYRYAEAGKAFTDSYTAVTGITSKDISASDQLAAYVKSTAANPFIKNLEIEKSYNFEFVISDRITSITESLMVDKGIPIFMPCDNGKVTVGMLPDVNSNADFQVGTDIMATDTKGKKRLLLEELDSINHLLVDKNSKLIKTIYLNLHPIGDIVFNTTGTNPGDIYGGEWLSWGKGRVPVGVDIANSRYNDSEIEGGEETHKLTVSEMPSHNHSLNKNVPYGIPYNNTSGTNSNNGGNTHYGESYNPFGIGNAGGGLSHNNMQPFVTCFMWKRTA